MRELQKVEKDSARQGALVRQTNTRLLARDERKQLKERRALLLLLLDSHPLRHYADSNTL